MNKYISYTAAILITIWTFTGCSSVAQLDSSTNDNTNGIPPEVIAEAEAQAKEQNTDFVQEQGGQPPEKIVELRYEETVKVYGPPHETFELFTFTGEPNWEHAYYIAQHLQVDYHKTAYIQYYSGTYGLESVLAAMDQSVPGVSQALKDFQQYHTVTDLRSDYWTQQLTSSATPQEKAELVVTSLANEYRKFYGDTANISTTQQGTVAAIAQLTGLSSADLAIIWEARGYVGEVIEILPNDWPYKAAVLELL